MEFDKVLTESLKRYKLNYKGTRKGYEIHDQNPYVLVIDEKYEHDGNGKSILGINLNYYKGNVKKLIKDINKNDNKNGFRGFEIKTKLRKKFSGEKDVTEWETEEKKRRYKSIVREFPQIAKYIRRYKISGVTQKKRKLIK